MDIEKLNIKTEKPVIRITFADLEDGCSRTVGSVNDKGEMLLAEINLSELPQNEILPKDGFLQFFIDSELNIDVNGIFGKQNCRVVLSDKPYDDSQDFQIDHPILIPTRMCFKMEAEPISISDDGIHKYLTEDEIDVSYNEINDGVGCKVLGYPAFAQFDPDRYPKYDTLLFQLDSDNEYIMWGDMGVGNFFINSKKLKKGDFSDVLFHWDCC